MGQGQGYNGLYTTDSRQRTLDNGLYTMDSTSAATIACIQSIVASLYPGCPQEFSMPERSCISLFSVTNRYGTGLYRGRAT